MGKAGLLPLAASRIAHHFRMPWLKFQREAATWTSKIEPGFFDSYPRFYGTSHTAVTPNRLNRRYEVMIAANESIIKGKSVVDIASHDGRWSLAAHKTGARQVTGIEAREHLVSAARESLKTYQVPEGAVRFVLGDVFEELDKLEPGSIDTIFCFGFFYHTMHHMLLLNKIARLRPSHLICDTAIDLDPDSIVEVHAEGVEAESAGAVPDPGSVGSLVVGSPTKSALELMVKSSGFTCNFFDWRHACIKRWDGLEDYHNGFRVTLVGSRTGS